MKSARTAKVSWVGFSLSWRKQVDLKQLNVLIRYDIVSCTMDGEPNLLCVVLD